MKHLLSCGLLLFGLATPALAHRLDECLQATRVALMTNGIDLSLDLTPGVAVANDWLVAIDKDGDGRISEEEGAAYSRRVLKDLRLALDQREVTLHLVEVSFPAPVEVRAGVGVVRIKTAATIPQLAAGDHVLTLTNAHLPKISVYLVNALVPKDPGIKIMSQTRDDLQTKYQLKFRVSLPAP
jgi:hypothetical protein